MKKIEELQQGDCFEATIFADYKMTLCIVTHNNNGIIRFFCKRPESIQRQINFIRYDSLKQKKKFIYLGKRCPWYKRIFGKQYKIDNISISNAAWNINTNEFIKQIKDMPPETITLLSKNITQLQIAVDTLLVEKI